MSLRSSSAIIYILYDVSQYVGYLIQMCPHCSPRSIREYQIISSVYYLVFIYLEILTSSFPFVPHIWLSSFFLAGLIGQASICDSRIRRIQTTLKARGVRSSSAAAMATAAGLSVHARGERRGGFYSRREAVGAFLARQGEAQPRHGWWGWWQRARAWRTNGARRRDRPTCERATRGTGQGWRTSPYPANRTLGAGLGPAVRFLPRRACVRRGLAAG
jgi:hypothetical protein